MLVMEEKVIFYDTKLGFIPGVCSGDIRDLITSDQLEKPVVGICIGVTPEEITGKQYRIYVEEDFYNRTKELQF